MKRSVVTGIVCALLSVGCAAEETPAVSSNALEAEIVFATGVLAGDDIATTFATGMPAAQAFRAGEIGSFHFMGNDGSLSLVACPLGNLDVDPYGTGEGGDPTAPRDPDGGISPACSPTVWYCNSGDCVDLEGTGTSVQISDQGDHRDVVFTGGVGHGDLRIAVRYREVS